MNTVITSGVTPAIIPFNFEGTAVRVLDQSGEPWWVLTDVCKVLEIANAPHAATRLDDDEKSTVAISDSGNLNADRTIINESGLWSLVLTSRKPAAKRFKKWITSEVIPSIRKTGGYMLAAPEETPEELALRAMSVLQATVERQKGQIADLSPKAVALQRIADAEGSLNLTEVAKALHVKRKDLIGWLGVHGWIYRRKGSGNWLGYASKEKAGYLTHKVNIERMPDGEDRVHEQVRITPNGLTRLAQAIPGAFVEQDAATPAKADPVPFAKTPA